MAKRSKRRRTGAVKNPAKLSSAEIERKAQGDLAAGRYREAIAGFKQLLKEDDRAEWRAALAEAYAGRARELTAKGMLKEARAIWENRAALGVDVALHPDQAALLLQLGQTEAVLALFGKADAAPAGVRDAVRPLLAAHIAAGGEGILESLPADDPAVLHAGAARTAIAAYCAGDDEALQAALRSIPFRSPYRDLVQILKALQRLPGGANEAAALLARVADDSPFAALKRAAELALLPEEQFLQALEAAGGATRRFACALRGWPPERVALLDELRRLGPEPEPQALLRFMYQHRAALGDEWVRRRALRLLVGSFPSSFKWLKAAQGRPLTAQEGRMVAAWQAEERNDFWAVWERWDAYARELMGQRPGADGELRHKLRVALVLRRCDQVGDVLSWQTSSGDPDGLDALVARQLEDSLTWDPDDRDTYLRLTQFYRRKRELKEARRLLDKAAARWPQDMQVLGAALDTALDAGSFKKAAKIAREMLALDPINSGVRERLVDAHLAHARKQIDKARPDLARKEIDAAREWARSAHARDQLDVNETLIAVLEGGTPERAALKALIDRLGGGLSAQVAFLLAGDALEMDPGPLSKKLGLRPRGLPKRDDLLAALGRLRAFLDRDADNELSFELAEHLDKALARAPWEALERGEMEAACESLRRAELHAARERAAEVALKRWRAEPVFELHAFEARYPHGYDGSPMTGIFRLEAALERANEAGDMRTAMRIGEILEERALFGGPPSPFGPPSALDPVENVLGNISQSEIAVALIETMGLDRALDMLGLPPAMKRDIKATEKRLGREAVIEALKTVFDMAEELGAFDDPAAPQPPSRKSPKGRGKKNVRGGGNADPDDPFSEQLDLF